MNNIRILGFQSALVICWSSGFIGAILAAETSSVYLVLLWRFVLAAVFLTPFILPYMKRTFLKPLAMHAVIGSLAMFGYLATGVKAIEIGVPAGTAALISSLQPLATAILAGIVLKESVSKGQWFGLILGFVGVMLAIGTAIGSVPVLGFILSLASMLSIVLATVLSKRTKLELPLLPTLAVHSLVSAILFFVVAWIEGAVVPETTQDFWVAVTWFMLLSTIGAYGFYWLCLREMSATKVSSLIYLTPPVTSIWAWVMFGQEISISVIVAFCICLVGVWMANRSTP